MHDNFQYELILPTESCSILEDDIALRWGGGGGVKCKVL